MSTNLVELRSRWRLVFAGSMALMGLLFATFAAADSFLAVIAGVLGAAVFLTLAVRGWRSGVTLESETLTSRGYMATRRYPRGDIERVAPEFIYEKFLVDTWAPQLTLEDGSEIPLRALANYSFNQDAPHRVVTWSDAISLCLDEATRSRTT